MLTKIVLENFKCFEKAKISELNDIVMLTGINNSGKSTILQGIVFLREWVLRGEGRYNDLGFSLYDFKKTVLKHNTDRDITIECDFRLTKEQVNRWREIIKKTPLFNELQLGWISQRTVGYSLSFNNVSIRRESILVKNKEIFLIDHIEGKIVFKLSNFSGNDDIELPVTGLSERNPMNWAIGVIHTKEYINPLLDWLREILRNNFASIYYISASREIPEWRSSVSKEPSDVGFRGEHTSSMLHYISSRRDSVFKDVEKWIKSFDYDINMLKSPLERGGSLIEFNKDGIDVNILTTGHGLNAVFPIILQCWASPPGSTILIEEPEIHLHKGAQKVIIDMFLKLSENRQIIFTTHSFDILFDIWERINWIDRKRDKNVMEEKTMRYIVDRKRKKPIKKGVDFGKKLDDWLNEMGYIIDKPEQKSA